MSVLFSPSLMCMDLLNMREEFEVLNQHCQMYHVDIMDGHFAKNLTLSPDFVRTIKRVTKLPIETHLMVEHPSQFIDRFIDAGADIITFHAETVATDAFRLLSRIRKGGCKTGVCLCPATPISAVEAYLDEIDFLTVMTVDIGYAGQTFIPQMFKKIKALDALRKQNNLSFVMQVDGAVGFDVYQELYESGVRAFVMGSSGLYKKGLDISTACAQMKQEFFKATGVNV